MTATLPYRPTASSPSAMGASCATRRCGHEHPDDLYPEIPAAEQEAYCGDHPGGGSVLRLDLWGVPAGAQLPEGDDRARDLYGRELARPVPRRALCKGERYHRKQRRPDGDAQP